MTRNRGSMAGLGGNRLRRWWSLNLLLAVLVGPGRAGAQSASFKSHAVTDELVALVVVGDNIVGGLDNGGLVISSRSAPGSFHQYTAGKQLTSNRITDLAWTGQYVWIATNGGGLTRLANPGPDPSFRPYSQGVGGLNITAVAGTVLGGVERVYYGIAEGGVGTIVNGRTGAIYTAASHGLIDDNVLDLAFLGDELFVATAVGVSRFADGVFTDQNSGLTNLYIESLAVDDAGNLLAAGRGGLYRWDPLGETWTLLGGVGYWIYQVSCGGGQTWIRSGDGMGGMLLGYWNGTDFTLESAPFNRIACIFAGSELWLGGPYRDPDMALASSLAYLARRDGPDDFTHWLAEGLLVLNCQGVTFGKDGRAWVGSDLGRAVSVLGGGTWQNIYALASAANDSSGLINHGGNVLSMATATDGRVWFNQFDAGVLVHDPATGTTTPVLPDDSPLSGSRVVRIVAHPQGPLLFLHDQGDAGLVDVLVDPAHWRDPASWYYPPTGTPGLAGALTVLDAVVERADIIWFAAVDVGLVRWDINGNNAGPDDPLTWSNPADDRWDPPLDGIPGVTNDPRDCEGLACGADGHLWAGGDGVVRFLYDPVSRSVVGGSVSAWDARAASSEVGLISGSVKDIALDANGDLWVASELGINRIKLREEGASIDAWLDLGNYLASDLFQILYSFNVITSLPGREYSNLAIDAQGRRLLIGADTGLAIVDIGELLVAQQEDLDSLFCYPNPFLPADAQGGLRLGGLASDAGAGDPARVDIYNLEGQLVFRDPNVSGETPFWDGRNRIGKDAATGMYIVKVEWRGMSAVRVVSLVR